MTDNDIPNNVAPTASPAPTEVPVAPPANAHYQPGLSVAPAFLVADDKFLILDDWGVLTLAEAGTEQFLILDRAPILQGRDAWGPMALAEGRLLARDSKTLVCIDLRAGEDN